MIPHKDEDEDQDEDQDEIRMIKADAPDGEDER